MRERKRNRFTSNKKQNLQHQFMTRSGRVEQRRLKSDVLKKKKKAESDTVNSLPNDVTTKNRFLKKQKNKNLTFYSTKDHPASWWIQHLTKPFCFYYKRFKLVFLLLSRNAPVVRVIQTIIEVNTKQTNKMTLIAREPAQRRQTEPSPASPASPRRQSRVPASTATRTTHPSMQGAHFSRPDYDSQHALRTAGRPPHHPGVWGLCKTGVSLCPFSLPLELRVGYHLPVANCDYSEFWSHSSLPVLLGQQNASG